MVLLRESIREPHAIVVVKLIHNHWAVDSVIERRLIVHGTDPGEVRVVEMGLDSSHERFLGARRQQLVEYGHQIQERLTLRGGKLGGADALERHDAIILVRSAESSEICRVPAARRHGVAGNVIDVALDCGLLPLFGRQGLHECQACRFLFVQYLETLVRSLVDDVWLGAYKERTNDYFTGETEDVEAEMVAVKVVAPRFGGRGCAEETEVVAVLVHHVGESCERAKESVHEHCCADFLIAFIRERGFEKVVNGFQAPWLELLETFTFVYDDDLFEMSECREAWDLVDVLLD